MSWNWRTKERLPNGELLTQASEVEKDYGRIFTPLFTTMFVAVVLACLIFWIVVGSAPGVHSHGHDDYTRAEVKEFAKEAGITNEDIKGPYTIADGNIGSAKCYGGGCSYLYGISKGAARTDSLMVIDDTRPTGGTALIYAWGCGTSWTLSDGNGFILPAYTHETHCNLKGHQTGQKVSGYATRWSAPSYHPQ